MRNANNIQISNNEIIMHILDPRNGRQVLSNRTISLENNDLLREFFCQHIQNSLQDAASKAARFRNINELMPSGICSCLLDQTTNLIDGSRQLAICLYEVMENNVNISPGDLVVCFYSADNYPGQRFLALLKIDPSEIFLQETRLDETGQEYVDLQLQGNALPTTKEKLQKCAFIRPLNPRSDDYDMLLLDRQTGTNVGREVARFFIHDFLDADLAFDISKRTTLLYRTLMAAHNQIRDQLPEELNQDLDNRINVALSNRSINLDVWLDQLPLEQEQKNVINNNLLNSMQDREFDLDPQLSQKLLRRRIFQGDYGFRFSIATEVYGQVVKDVIRITDDPERQPFYRVIIETDSWREVTR